MLGRKSKEKNCDMKAMLFRHRVVYTSYDTEGCLRRSMVFLGRIDDSHDDDITDPQDDRFHGKGVLLRISSPRNPEWEEKVKAMDELENVCGSVRVSKDVEPPRFEVDGKVIEGEPVQVSLVVTDEAFNAIRQQASEAYDHHRILEVSLTLVGKSLPDTDSVWGFRWLKDFDVSEERQYAIGSFSILDTLQIHPLWGRVLPFDLAPEEHYGASISILLTEARYDILVDRGYLHSISCEGRVIRGRGKPFDGVHVTIEFDEHEPNPETDELPERAFAGVFEYWPERPENEHSSTHFLLELKHLPDDARELLLPVLSQEVGTRVVLRVSLENKEDELLAATRQLSGNVRAYSFSVQKCLIRDETVE